MSGRTGDGRAWIALMLLAAIGAASGCSVAPLVQDAGRTGPSLFDYLDAARSVSVRASDGTTLHGAFVEAAPGAPIVLHLLPSSASVTTGVPIGVGRIDLADPIVAMRAAGLSSIVFDYRGVGGSDGSRDAARVLEDGRAMWSEAVRRAGGREDRVIIRAASLGTIVAADLLDRGAAPAGAILFAPVRASTVTRHAIRHHRGRLGGLLGRVMYRSLDAPDLALVLSRTSVPTLVLLPERDDYLPPAEADMIRAGASSREHTVTTMPGDHRTLVARAWGFEIDDLGFAGRRAPDLLAEEVAFIVELRSRLHAATGD